MTIENLPASFLNFCQREAALGRDLDRAFDSLAEILALLDQTCQARRAEFDREFSRVGEGNVHFDLSDVEEGEACLRALRAHTKDARRAFADFTDHDAIDIDEDED